MNEEAAGLLSANLMSCWLEGSKVTQVSMATVYEISEEELQIFLDESEDQIHILEDGLVRLEKDGRDPDLINAMFRAAHTLKGSGGLIGHRTLTDLTHRVENAFDALRKDEIDISAKLVDVCLDSVDMLRQFCDDIADGRPSDEDVEPLIGRLEELLGKSKPTASSGKRDSDTSRPRRRRRTRKNSMVVEASIIEGSAASAARAFQLMLALQDSGEIIRMDPDQKKIETAQPVREFMAEIMAAIPEDRLVEDLLKVDDLESLCINGREVKAPATQTRVSYKEPMRLGEYLISLGLITREDLESALKVQRSTEGEREPIGRILVRRKVISQEALDKAVAGQVEELRTALKAVNETEPRHLQVSAEKTIRTSIERLDTLMNLVGELVTDRNRLERIHELVDERLRGDELLEDLSQTIAHLGRISDQLQEEVMTIRMQPVARIYKKLPRLIRDLARKNGKQIDLLLDGADTEMDRTVIEKISDPLVHLLRNAADHGIENPQDREACGKAPRGSIRVLSKHENGQIIITISDDGRGIQAAAVKQSAVTKGFLTPDEAEALSYEETIDLIFQSGLSTAKVVNAISGRGVGMDIVRSNVEKLGGSITVESCPGEGTTFQLIMPLTLAIMQTLLVRLEEIVCAIPLVSVTRTLRVPSEVIQRKQTTPAIVVEDRFLPLISLRDALGLTPETVEPEYQHIVMIRFGKSQAGLIVDGFVGEEDVMVKPLGLLSEHTDGVSGAAILGDGEIALIVDIQSVIKLAQQAGGG